MVIALVNVLKDGIGEVHVAELVFRNVPEHQPPHAGVLVNDIGEFLLRQPPPFQDASAFVRRHALLRVAVRRFCSCIRSDLGAITIPAPPSVVSQ